MPISRIEYLESRAVSPTAVRPDGNYTNPRTWGVYRIGSTGLGEIFRLGNHPIRQVELVREQGVAELLFLFAEREDALELKHLLNERHRSRR